MGPCGSIWMGNKYTLWRHQSYKIYGGDGRGHPNHPRRYAALAPTPFLTMSQNALQLPGIITGDTSPLPSALIPEATWELQHSPYSASSIDTADWGYYAMPLSPPTSLSSHLSDSPEPPTKRLRLSESPDRLLEGDHQHCIPTQKVFDLPEAPVPSSPSVCQLPPSANPLLSQKFLASNAGVKRTRGSVERISTKDFVPPDVSGLSKREARLVKNRAAAFLSRQRKREEFEAMEVWVSFTFSTTFNVC